MEFLKLELARTSCWTSVACVANKRGCGDSDHSQNFGVEKNVSQKIHTNMTTINRNSTKFCKTTFRRTGSRAERPVLFRTLMMGSRGSIFCVGNLHLVPDWPCNMKKQMLRAMSHKAQTSHSPSFLMGDFNFPEIYQVKWKGL